PFPEPGGRMVRPALLLTLTTAVWLALPAAAGPRQPAQKDIDRLRGTWKVLAVTADGKEAGAEMFAKVRYVFDGDSLEYREENGGKPGRYKLDTTAPPLGIDVIGPNGAVTARGIYRFDGDVLIWCFVKGAEKRPTEFASPAESATVLIRLKKV